MMAGSVNKVILVGNVGRDPEIRTMNSGDRVANLSLATSESWRDKASGERKEKTEWHRVTVMNDNIVKVIESYVSKGSTIYVEGSLQTRKWTDQQGVEKFSTEVMIGRFNGQLTLLGGKPQDQGDDYSQGFRRSDDDGFSRRGGGGGDPQSGGFGRGATDHYDMNDDIPFARPAMDGEA